ncbi:hypothetical protein FNV43_RR21950 [Rhamnella rubrinervis]|uniref:RWP-RK domain-containing protein n=1 Tax=Rhamnella rubrinervis TaxID=2594499 RepID=A0A8K0GS26_9ROSA|nr:hypothetical protein FNV43_RR21950 [Rhamnella rubrinervis]
MDFFVNANLHRERSFLTVPPLSYLIRHSIKLSRVEYYKNMIVSNNLKLPKAIGYLKECTEDKDVLVQIWVPIRSGIRPEVAGVDAGRPVLSELRVSTCELCTTAFDLRSSHNFIPPNIKISLYLSRSRRQFNFFNFSFSTQIVFTAVRPATLKRICRQHGITRWPSRKTKKVGHSLRKLQLVIDSVQGAEGTIQIGSFYSSFPELSSPKFPGAGPFSLTKLSDHYKQLNSQSESGLFSEEGTMNSPSSSCSQTSGPSVCAVGAQQHTTNLNAMSSAEALKAEDHVGMLKRACSDAEVLACNLEEVKIMPRSQSYESLSENRILETLPPLPGNCERSFQDGGAFRVQANFGDEKIRFSLQPIVLSEICN